MRRFKLVFSAATAAMMLLAFGSAQAGTRTETKPYVPWIQSVECPLEPVGVTVGGNCFDVTGVEAIDVIVTDDTIPNVASVLGWKDASGTTIGGPTTFCGSVSDVAVPSNAVRAGILNVVAGPAFVAAFGGQVCPLATTGTITVTFHTPGEG